MSDHLNDEAVEAFFSGHRRDQPLGELLASIADHYEAIPCPVPGPELAAFISTGALDDAELVDLIGARRRRQRAIIAALTGTVVGKVMIGVSVAAASVAGMQASGIVDVPMLPDAHHGTFVQNPEPEPVDTRGTTPPTSSLPTSSLPTPVTARLDVDAREGSSDGFRLGEDAGSVVNEGPHPKPIAAQEQQPEPNSDKHSDEHSDTHSDEDSDEHVVPDDNASDGESARDGDHDDDDREENLADDIDVEHSGVGSTDSDTAHDRSDHGDTDDGRDRREDD